MKTTRFYTINLFILSGLLAVVLNVTTTKTVSNLENPPAVVSEEHSMMPEFNLEDEAYVDDIPFNTECVAKNCIYQKAMAEVFNMPEEEYVDDIPFNTRKVASENKRSMK